MSDTRYSANFAQKCSSVSRAVTVAPPVAPEQAGLLALGQADVEARGRLAAGVPEQGQREFLLALVELVAGEVGARAVVLQLARLAIRCKCKVKFWCSCSC